MSQFSMAMSVINVTPSDLRAKTIRKILVNKKNRVTRKYKNKKNGSKANPLYSCLFLFMHKTAFWLIYAVWIVLILYVVM